MFQFILFLHLINSFESYIIEHKVIFGEFWHNLKNIKSRGAAVTVIST